MRTLAITDPDALAEEACKVGLIHPESKRILQSFPADAKTAEARSLLQSVEGKIKDQPVYFQYFLALLKKLPGLTSLGIIIQKTYGKLQYPFYYYVEILVISCMSIRQLKIPYSGKL